MYEHEQTEEIQQGRYVVGLDQSYSSTGVVVLDTKSGAISSHVLKAGEPRCLFHKRIHILWEQLKNILPQPEQTLVIMEGASYASKYNVFMLGELSGALKILLYLNGYAYNIVQPTVLKKFATGSGNALKQSIAAKVAERWGFTNSSNDVIDVFVLAKIGEEKMNGGNKYALIVDLFANKKQERMTCV